MQALVPGALPVLVFARVLLLPPETLALQPTISPWVGKEPQTMRCRLRAALQAQPRSRQAPEWSAQCSQQVRVRLRQSGEKRSWEGAHGHLNYTQTPLSPQ